MVEWAIAGLASASGLFGYNRENYMFDKEQQIVREYQGQDMRIKQFELYREDIRDLVGLTVSKMDNYLIVNTLQLGFTITLFTEGRPNIEGRFHEIPWLIWLYAICNVGAFLYFLMSIWLSMHASIAAHSFGVRLLTQFVRLPVPNKFQLDAARALAVEYEGLGMGQLLRVPVLRQQLRNLNNAIQSQAIDDDAASDEHKSDAGDDPDAHEDMSNPAALLRHVQLYRQLQGNWQAYDAYARVCMAMGTNQLLHALSYYCLGMLIGENWAPWPALGCVVMFTTCAWLLARLDLYLSKRLMFLAGVLLSTPPILAMISTTLWVSNYSADVKSLHKALVPVAFLFHLLWVMFILFVAKADQVNGVALPTKFRAVLYLDVFGWMGGTSQPAERTAANAQGSGAASGSAADGPLRGLGSSCHSVTSGGSAFRRMSSLGAGASHLPRNLRASLNAECYAMHQQLESDIALWEQRGVQDLMQGEEMTVADLEETRTHFDAAFFQLRASGDGPPAIPRTEADPEETVWLKFEWNPSGSPMLFYYQPESEQSVWTRPATGRISVFEELQENVVTFGDKVRGLSVVVPSSSRRVRFEQPPGDTASPPAPGVRVEEGAFAPTHAHAPTRGIIAPLREPLLDQNPAQESAFGGSEAARNPEQTDQFAHSSTAGNTFYVAQSNNRAADRGKRAPPGQMPWRTFWQGSTVLIVVWALGTIWSVVSCWFGVDIALAPKEHEKPELRVHPELVFASVDAYPFFNPKTLACHDSIGPVLFVTDKYGVYEMRLGSDIVGNYDTLRPALSECLAQAPQFQAAGLAGMSIDCPDTVETDNGVGGAAPCTAVFLGLNGKTALRCPLEGERDGSSGHSTPRPFDLHGGHWGGVAAGDGEALWALGASGLVQLRQLLGSNHGELVPQLELPLPEAVNVTQLHVLAGQTLLALESSGVLHSWPLWGGLRRSWRFIPPYGSRADAKRWAGMCATGEHIYFLGSSERRGLGGPTGLWRIRLPQDLRISGPAA